jgi:hypothetical protein
MKADSSGSRSSEILAEVSLSRPDFAGGSENTSGWGGAGFSVAQPPMVRDKKDIRGIILNKIFIISNLHTCFVNIFGRAIITLTKVGFRFAIRWGRTDPFY